MVAEHIQLYGGPLDGLELDIAERKPRLIFPVLVDVANWHLQPIETDCPVQNIVYEWFDPPGRFLWRGMERAL